MKRWYQEAIIGGVVMPDTGRTDTSAYRWETLLAPLIPEDGRGRLLVDLGCNAGFYCRQARDLGYMALGVERDPGYLGQARYWEAEEPKGVRLVEADLGDYDPPACFLALLCQVHYWLEPEALAALVARLRAKAAMVLVVGRHRGHARHASPADEETARQTFAGWQERGRTADAKHYGLLLRNHDLHEVHTAALFARQPFVHSPRFLPSFREYIDLVLSGKAFDPAETAFAAYLRQRRFRHYAERLEHYRQMIVRVAGDGYLGSVLAARADGQLRDGNHRLMIAERLGLEVVLCRRR